MIFNRQKEWHVQKVRDDKGHPLGYPSALYTTAYRRRETGKSLDDRGIKLGRLHFVQKKFRSAKMKFVIEKQECKIEGMFLDII